MAVQDLESQLRAVRAELAALAAGDERLTALRRREATLAELVAIEKEPAAAARMGTWAPLQLHEAEQPSPRAEVVEFSERAEGGLEHRVERHTRALYEYRVSRAAAVRLMSELMSLPLSTSQARVVAAVLEDYDEGALAAVLCERAGLPRPSLAPHLEPIAKPRAEWTPSEKDGLTEPQRAVVEVLALAFPSKVTERTVIEEASTRGGFERETIARAVEQLCRPRPHPLVGRQSTADEHRFALTPFAMEMVDVRTDGTVDVHGAFVPNLLVNGVADPLAFPVHRLPELVRALRLLVMKPGQNEHSLAEIVEGPEMGRVAVGWPRELSGTGRGELRFHAQATFSLPAVRLSHLPPGVSGNLVAQALRDASARGELTGIVSVNEVDNGVVYEVSHPAFARAPLRWLFRASFLVRRFEASLEVVNGTGDREVVWPGGLLHRFYSRTRNHVAWRQKRKADELRERLALLDGQSTASPELLRSIVDRALDHQEALWGLMNLGTPEFAAHAAFRGLQAENARPLSRSAAEQWLRRPGKPVDRSAERARLELELREVEDAVLTPDRLDRLVLDELERVAARHPDPPRETLIVPTESLLSVLYVAA